MSDDIFKSFGPLPAAPAKGAPPPVSIGDVWSASRTLQGQDASDADERRMMRAYTPYIDAINEMRRREGLPEMYNPVLGRRLNVPRASAVPRLDTNNPYAVMGSAYGYAQAARDNAPGSFVQVGRDAAQQDVLTEVARIRRTHPEFLRGMPDTPDKIMGAAIERDKTERDSARAVMSRSSGFVQGAVGIAGGITKSVEDPFTIASMLIPLGGGPRSLGGIFAREFAINSGMTALMQPQVAANRAELGDELTTGEAVGNILSGGIGGGAIGTGMRVAGPSVGRMFGGAYDAGVSRLYDALPKPLQERWAGRMSIPDGAIPDAVTSVIGKGNIDPDTQASLHVVQRYHDIADSSPFPRTPQNDEAHFARIDQGVADLQRTEPVPSRGRLRDSTSLSSGGLSAPLNSVARGDPELERYFSMTRSRESGGSDTAAAATSSAYGRYQFIRGTWLRYYVQRFGRGGLSDAEILAKRADGALQDRLMLDVTQDNAATLRRNGQPVTADNLYLLHFLGPADGVKVLHAEPGTPIRELVRPESVRANPFIRDMTSADLRNWSRRRMGGHDAEMHVDAPDVGDDTAATLARLDSEGAALDQERANLDREGTAPGDATGDAMAGFVDGAPRPDAPPAPVPTEELAGRWKAAVAALTERQAGEVPNVLWHPATGWIDLKWGAAGTGSSDGSGLAKIVAHHAEVLDDLPERLAEMRVAQESPNRIKLESDTHDASVRLDWDGKEQKWLLTAYRRGDAPAAPVYARDAAVGRASPDLEAAPPIAGNGARVDSGEPAPYDDYPAIAEQLGGERGETDGPWPQHHDDPIWAAIDRHEAEQAMQNVAASMPQPEALKTFADPGGAATEAAIDSGMHDLRQLAEASPDAKFRIDAEGEERTLGELLEGLDEEDAAIAAVKGCL